MSRVFLHLVPIRSASTKLIQPKWIVLDNPDGSLTLINRHAKKHIAISADCARDGCAQANPDTEADMQCVSATYIHGRDRDLYARVKTCSGVSFMREEQ